jgi:hypothetical protein
MITEVSGGNTPSRSDTVVTTLNRAWADSLHAQGAHPGGDGVHADGDTGVVQVRVILGDP